MKTLSFILLFLSLGSLTAVFKTNELASQAEVDFKSKEYQKAATKLDSLLSIDNLPKESLQLNLAHTYFLQLDTTNLKKAKSYYSLVSGSERKELATISFNQLGNTDFFLLKNKNQAFAQGQLDATAKKEIKAIMEQYKQAMRVDQFNEEARYNYELLHWLLKVNEQQNNNQDQKDNKEQNKDQQDKNQQQDQNKDNQQKGDNKEQKDGKDQNKEDQQKGQDGKKDKESKQGDQKNSKQGQEEKKGDEQKQGKEGEKKKGEEGRDGKPLKEIKLSKEQAMQLIRSGQSKEKKYLEREMKKSSEPVDTDKPDW